MRIEISWDGVCWVLHVLDEDASNAKDRDFDLYQPTAEGAGEAVSLVLYHWENRQGQKAKKEVSDEST